jgi:hypothetical protein
LSTYEPQVGDAIVMEHPMFNDRVVVCFVEKVTAQMVGVQYLDRYGTLVTTDTRMRKRTAILGKLRDDITMKEAQKLANDFHTALTEAEKVAKAAFLASRNTLLQGTN